MSLVVVKIITLNQCGVMWKKIAVVAAMLLLIKKRKVLIYYENEKRIRQLKILGSNKNLTLHEIQSYIQGPGFHR